MSWQHGDRVKVCPDHHGTGLAGRVGTVLRVAGAYVEVELDSYYLAGIGIVAFLPADLMPTTSRRQRKRKPKPADVTLDFRPT
jgi:hypothetical protein